MKDGAYCLTLTDAQISAVENLNALLEGHPYNSKDIFLAVDDLAVALYMPTNTIQMGSNIFVSPVVAFMCLRAVAEGGGFLPPKSITGNLVALQCDVRLCIFFVVMKFWHQRMTTGGLEADGDWFQ
jgi:hypothetical protein